MPTPLHEKSSTDEIRARFDGDVERFSQLATGQSSTMDAPLTMALITEAAVASSSPIHRVLDIGCGAGNNALKLRQALGEDFVADLLDLSRPMLDRAAARLHAVNAGKIRCIQADFREAELPSESYDVILAAAMLHHLRDDADWEAAFSKIHRLLVPGGSVWISDLVSHESAPVQTLMWQRYAAYLRQLGGRDYQEEVFSYIDKEDSPRPLTYQLALFRQVGFTQVEVLHKNGCFAAFGAIK